MAIPSSGNFRMWTLLKLLRVKILEEGHKSTTKVFFWIMMLRSFFAMIFLHILILFPIQGGVLTIPSTPLKVKIYQQPLPQKEKKCVVFHIIIPPSWVFYGFHQPKDTLINDPVVIWKKSNAIKNPRIVWPTSLSLEKEGETFQGYQQDLFLPCYFEIHKNKDSSWFLEFSLSAMMCYKVCIPFTWTYGLSSKDFSSLPIYEGSQDVFYQDQSPPQEEKKSFLFYLFMAFIGGLILNIMPCVLPVLGLKLKSFSKGGSLRFLCTFTFLGIMAGFLFLGLFFLVLREGFGFLMGWGGHMNHPLIALFMTGALLLSSYSLFGFFHLSPPSWATSLMPQQSAGAFSSFFSGVLAVFLATPCSAPFLGSALGFAFVQPSLSFLLFFFTIGVGFGFPYVLGILWPWKITLPSPGSWMMGVEYLMAFVFLLSSLWFFSTSYYPLVDEVFHPWVQGIFCYLMIIPLGYFFLSFFKSSWFVGGSLVISFVFLSVVPFYKPSGRTLELSMKDGSLQWQPFDEKKIPSLLKEGKIVFIDITGHGCLLCRLNKKIFLRPKVQRRFQQGDIVCMRGDYGQHQEKILPFLQKYGRFAIPFNLVLRQDYPQGLVLSERLSEEELLVALETKNSQISYS